MAQVLFDEATRVYPGAELPAVDDSTWTSPTASSSSSRGLRLRKTVLAAGSGTMGLLIAQLLARGGESTATVSIAKLSAYPWPNNSSAQWQFSTATRQHCDSMPSKRFALAKDSRFKSRLTGNPDHAAHLCLRRSRIQLVWPDRRCFLPHVN